MCGAARADRPRPVPYIRSSFDTTHRWRQCWKLWMEGRRTSCFTRDHILVHDLVFSGVHAGPCPLARRRTLQALGTRGVPSYRCPRHPCRWTKLARLWLSPFLQAYQDPSALLQITPASPAPPCTLAHAADDPSKPKLRASSTSHPPKRRQWWISCYRCPPSVPPFASSTYLP